MPGTVKLHRVFKAPPERVYRAFLDPDAMVKWLPPQGFTGKVQAMNATVGGGYKMSFTNFGTGSSHSFGGTYLELVPGSRIRFKAVVCGTELEVVQEGIPDLIPVEFCYLGWQESLQLLALLVEPEIPDGA